MKKVISFILATVLTVSFFTPAFAFEKADTLRFNDDGKFKIMIFSDIHEGGTGGGEACLKIMNEAIDKCNPDLVVYLGDNSIADSLEEHREIISRITEPVRKRNIPFASVFGNHDAQSENVTKEALLEIYREFGCLSYDGGDNLYGCGNFNLPVLSSSSDDVKFNLWFFDSGSDNPDKEVGGYDYIREDQIEWYKNTALLLKEQSDGEAVPALAFQHIAVPEIYDKMFTELPLPVGEGTLNGYNGKVYSRVPKFSGYEGIAFEQIGSPYCRTQQLPTMREVGDVMAVFSGHDHVNSFRVDLDGIDWVSVPTVHNKNYSNDCLRGAGLITLDEKNAKSYEYTVVRACDLVFEKDSHITDAGDSTGKFVYAISKAFADILLFVQKIFNGVRDCFNGKTVL